MKTHILVLTAISLSLASCDSKPGGDTATVADEKSTAEANGISMQLDTNASSVKFTGWGVGKNHPGKFEFRNGEFTVKNGLITSGNFTIDINSIVMEQQEEMFQKNLRTHLLSVDFFDVVTYPVAKFEITGSEKYVPTGNDTSVIEGANMKISGNLTMKDVTKNVTFPAKVEISDDKVTAKADFLIDRTKWNMSYHADQESMKDKFISPDVNINLDIVGKR